MRRALAIALVSALVAACLGAKDSGGVGYATMPPITVKFGRLYAVADTYVVEGSEDVAGDLPYAYLTINSPIPSRYAARYEFPEGTCVTSARHVLRFLVEPGLVSPPSSGPTEILIATTPPPAELGAMKQVGGGVEEQFCQLIVPEDAFPNNTAVVNNTIYRIISTVWNETTATWGTFDASQGSKWPTVEWTADDPSINLFSHALSISDLNQQINASTEGVTILLQVTNNGLNMCGNLVILTKEGNTLSDTLHSYIDYTYNACTSEQTCNVTTGACEIVCYNGGTVINGQSCECPLDFDGPQCEFARCGTLLCKANQQCEKVNNVEKCVCKNSTLLMPDCDTPYTNCGDSKCYYGTCLGEDLASLFCDCSRGYTGRECNVDIDECKDNTMCQNNGRCVDGIDSFTCKCPEGVTGKYCEIAPCTTTLRCYFNTMCRNVNGNDRCICSDPKTVYPECNTGAKMCNETRCYQGKCDEGVCKCALGWEGDDCNTNINECRTQPCKNGTCTDGVDSYYCDCEPGFNGTQCENDMCGVCKNGAACVRFPGGVQCNCTAGFNGTRCENDMCSVCQNGAACVRIDGGVKCNCTTGFFGNYCQDNYCAPNPCQNNGTCQSLLSGYKCNCTAGFNGTRCENDLCSPNPCKNNGTCSGRAGGDIKCNCTIGFYGDRCEIDYCQPNPCANSGTCSHDATKNFKCACPAGWGGDKCTTIITCPAETVNGTKFDETRAGNTATGTCAPGYSDVNNSQRPERTCYVNGTWSAVSNPCLVRMCPKIHYPTAAFDETPALQNATGRCEVGYRSDVPPTAYCNANGEWSETTPCKLVHCPAKKEGGASWNETEYGQVAYGKCDEGLAGSPLRPCLATGEFGVIESECAPAAVMCSEGAAGGYDWGNTVAGGTAKVNCPTGQFGALERHCDQTGAWQAVVNRCKLDPQPVTQVTVVSMTSNSATLQWNKAPEADMYVVELLVNGTFRTSKGADGQDNDEVRQSNSADTISAVVGGLNTFTSYYIRVLSVAINGGVKKSVAQLDITPFRTELAYPTNVDVKRASRDYELTISWSPAPPATMYQVYYWTESSLKARADTTTGPTVIQIEGEPPVTVLLPNSTVDPVMVMTKSGIEENGQQYWSQGSDVFIVQPNVFSPPAPADGQQQPGPDDASNWRVIVIAASVAGGIVLIALVIAFIVMRRRDRHRRRGKEDMELDLMSMTAARSSMSMGRGTLTHHHSVASLSRKSEPPPYRSTEVTLLNTTSELSVPGFFIIDPSTAYRGEGLMSTGGAGSIERVTLMDNEMIQRNMGATAAAAKTVPLDNDTEQEAETKKRLFEQEIMALWSLQSCPNVINLLGFSRTPHMVMVLELADMDLTKYLHQTPSSAKDPKTIVQLASDVATGIAAVHKIGLIHRDIKSQNILIFQPFDAARRVAKLCDFGLVRFDSVTAKRSTVRDFINVGGFSPRYAAPEVFARTLLGTEGTPEEDRKADVYALGVVLWELVALEMPWDGYNKDDIMEMVKQGVRPPVPDLGVRKLPTEYLKLLNGLLNVSALCQQEDPSARPVVETVASSLLTVRSKI